MKRFFISDHHFMHKNIIRHTEREFKNSKHMTEHMIGAWNSVVKKDDEVFHIGDFAWGTDKERVGGIVQRLNGTKHLILGNHDKIKPFDYVEMGFTSVHTSLALTIGGKQVYLAHDPACKAMLSPEDTLLHGHVHRLWKYQKENRLINLSVENWDYRPVSEYEIQKILDLFDS